MRIGLAVGYFDPQVGGSEEVVKRIALGLSARGHDVVVATSRDDARDHARMVVPVREFDVRGNLAQGMAGDVLGYQSFLRDSDRDVWLFYAAQIWSTDTALPLLRDMRAASVVVPCGYSGLRLPQFADYYRALPSFLADAGALAYMSMSYQDAEHDAAAGLGHLARIVPNGADAGEFSGAPLPLGSSMGRTVLTVANHIPAKGHDAAIRAFREAAGPDDLLVVVGEVHDRDPRRTCWYRCRAWSLRDRRIVMARGLPREEVVHAFASADVFLLASEVECSPLVVIEAMAAGVPFLSTDAGNVRDWTDSGLVVDRSDLGQGLARLLGDADQRQALGAAGRARWSRDHTWDVIMDAYETLFTDVVQRRKEAAC